MDEVRLLRESRGWSQVELAARAGVSNKTVSDAESERGSLNVRSLKKIAQALGVGLGELFPVEYGSWSLGALTDRAKRLRDEHKAALDAGDLERAARVYQRRVMVANKIHELDPPLCTITVRPDKPPRVLFYREPTDDERRDLHEQLGEYEVEQALLLAV